MASWRGIAVKIEPFLGKGDRDPSLARMTPDIGPPETLMMQGRFEQRTEGGHGRKSRSENLILTAR
jgi:hypothetical protein